MLNLKHDLTFKSIENFTHKYKNGAGKSLLDWFAFDNINIDQIRGSENSFKFSDHKLIYFFTKNNDVLDIIMKNAHPRWLPDLDTSKKITECLLSKNKCSIFDVEKIIEENNLQLEKTVNRCNDFKKNYHKDILRMINMASDQNEYSKLWAKNYNKATEEMIQHWEKDKDSAKFFNKFKRLTGVNKMDKKEGGLVTEMKDKDGNIKTGAD